MPNDPSAEELLRAAHRSMKERILPALPQDQKSEGAMVARVLAIVLAELSEQGEIESRILHLWANVYPDLRDAPVALPVLEARIMRDVQSGHFDSVEHRDRFELALQEHAALQLASSNPRFVVAPPKNL